MNIFFVIFFTSASAAASSDKNTITVNTRFQEIKILHTSNLNNRIYEMEPNGSPCHSTENCIGGLARMATFINDNKETLNFYTGNSYSFTYHGSEDDEMGTLLSELNFHAVSLGLHDFKSMKSLAKYIRDIKVPVICTNLDISYVPELHDIPNLKKWELFQYPEKNLSVAVVSFLDYALYHRTNMNELVINRWDIDINLAIETIRKLTKGTDLIIVAIGDNSDSNSIDILMAGCPELDILICSSQFGVMTNNKDLVKDTKDSITEPYPRPHKRSSVSLATERAERYLVTSYGLGRYMGVANVQLDRYKNKLILTGDEVLLSNETEPNPSIKSKVNKHLAKRMQLLNQVVGHTKVCLDAENCHINECAFYNLITEAVIFYNVQYLATVPNQKYWTHAAISFIATREKETSLQDDDGNISVLNIFRAMSNREEFYIIQVFGSTIKLALEHSAEMFARKEKSGTLHMFGVRVEYNLFSNSGNRVKEVKVLCSQCVIPRYELLEPERKYNIVISDMLYHRGYGYLFQEDVSQYSTLLPLSGTRIVWNFIQHQYIVHTHLDQRTFFTPVGRTGTHY